MTAYEEVEEDLVLSSEDVVEVLEDDGETSPEPMEEDQTAEPEAEASEPMIKDVEGEPRERPDNAIAGTCE